MSGILTLAGTTTAANYQAAIRSITYENAFTTESTAVRTISIAVTDGANTTTAITRDIDFVIDNTVEGTAGDDTLHFGGAHGADRIVDFEQGVDMIEFDGS